MVVYIKSNIPENYVEFPEPLDPVLYGNIGETWEDYCNGKWVQLSEGQVEFRRKNPASSVKEVFHKKNDVGPRTVKTLEDAKLEAQAKIHSYDNSYMVNQFFINDYPVWFDKSERSNLFMRINAEKKVGAVDTTIWYNDQEFIIGVDEAMDMMYKVETYASMCYDCTKRHLIAIKEMKTKKAVENYDFTANYPEKLRFNYAKK